MKTLKKIVIVQLFVAVSATRPPFLGNV